MGSSMSKIMNENSCMKNNSDFVQVPRYHFKCRFHTDDVYSKSQAYTRTKDILVFKIKMNKFEPRKKNKKIKQETTLIQKRYPVPRDKIKWNIDYDEYEPVEFSSEKILANNGLNWKDPHVDSSDFSSIKFNEIDQKYNCDRKSHHGPYKFVQYSQSERTRVPQNPVGRTGLIGRGHLGRWGPNHAADPIVTTWKRNKDGAIEIDPNSKKPILQFVAIQRRDTKEWAIPGGMRDPGELITKTLLREFSEEALNKELKFDKFDRVMNHDKNDFEKKLGQFFHNGIVIYKGYVDDPRNTEVNFEDNAWMETIACNFHDENGNIVGLFKLEGGDDAEKATWLDLNSKLSLFASHVDFLREVAGVHKATW